MKKLLFVVVALILVVAIGSTGCVGTFKRAVGMKPSWRVVNDTEAAPYMDKSQCYGLGIYNQYVDSCPMVIQAASMGMGACYDLAFVHHLDEIDGCIQDECVLVLSQKTSDIELCEIQMGIENETAMKRWEEEYKNFNLTDNISDSIIWTYVPVKTGA
jgi:hypothetical protein